MLISENRGDPLEIVDGVLLSVWNRGGFQHVVDAGLYVAGVKPRNVSKVEPSAVQVAAVVAGEASHIDRRAGGGLAANGGPFNGGCGSGHDGKLKEGLGAVKRCKLVSPSESPLKGSGRGSWAVSGNEQTKLQGVPVGVSQGQWRGSGLRG